MKKLLLWTEGPCSNVDLADAVGFSPCLLRTKRLQKIGLIRGYSVAEFE